MPSDLDKLSESDLQAVIVNAEKELQVRKDKKRKEVIAEIRKLAASIGVTVEISESGKALARKGRKVPPKYQHPTDPSKQWSGRGMKPNWLKELLVKGQKIEKFAIKK